MSPFVETLLELYEESFYRLARNRTESVLPSKGGHVHRSTGFRPILFFGVQESRERVDSQA